jgi:hypothetical protein
LIVLQHWVVVVFEEERKEGLLEVLEERDIDILQVEYLKVVKELLWVKKLAEKMEVVQLEQKKEWLVLVLAQQMRL